MEGEWWWERESEGMKGEWWGERERESEGSEGRVVGERGVRGVANTYNGFT